MNTTTWLIALLYAYVLSPRFADAAANPGLSKGQTLYVPAYSHIYGGNKESPFLLTVTLSIRNIDPKHPITIELVDYFETQGRLLNITSASPSP